MSEQPVTQPEDTKPTEAAPTEVEAAIISPDPEVVEANLAKTEPVTDAIEPVSTEAAPAATTEEVPATTEETPAEAPAAAAEKKEGSGLVAFIKKRIPNPKSVDKKAVPPKTETEAAPVPEAVEPAEGPFEGDTVSFKSHGGIFGGGWKDRRLEFGKEGGLTTAALAPYVGAHKIAAVISPTDKINAAWDNAAHASVTGVGLLYVTKYKNLEVPISVINLADVTSVTVNNTHFTIKTEHGGDYEFGTNSADKAQKWKAEIDTRTEQAKLTRSAVVESDNYKESLAYFKDLRGSHKTPEAAVTSDEEAGVSGDEAKRPKGWTRRISGSFGKLTGGSKEAPKDVPVVAPTESTADTAAEAAVVETPAVAETTEPAATETPAEAPPADDTEIKKEKRKSFTGFAGLFKSKAPAKESSPEPAAKETAPEENPAVEPTTEAPAATETPAATEEPASTPAPEVKSKRQSIFAGLIPKKDKPVAPPATNGETPAEPETTEQPIAEETPAEPTEEAEYKPPAAEQKQSLARRLTSQFKSLGRSKSPEKSSKATKVSDEAPKIDTPIESSAPATDVPAVSEPLTTTEAPAVELPPTTSEQTPAVVTTQA